MGRYAMVTHVSMLMFSFCSTSITEVIYCAEEACLLALSWWFRGGEGERCPLTSPLHCTYAFSQLAPLFNPLGNVAMCILESAVSLLEILNHPFYISVHVLVTYSFALEGFRSR